MSEETGRETEVVEETAVETKSTEGKQNPADVTGGVLAEAASVETSRKNCRAKK